MGRGRAKAKQTKVARQLKYNSGGTDLDALRRELVGENGSEDPNRQVDGSAGSGDHTDDVDDPYAAYADEADDDWDQGYASGR
jgi:Protein of unknown function (DUF3073)